MPKQVERHFELNVLNRSNFVFCDIFHTLMSGSNSDFKQKKPFDS